MKSKTDQPPGLLPPVREWRWSTVLSLIELVALVLAVWLGILLAIGVRLPIVSAIGSTKAVSARRLGVVNRQEPTRACAFIPREASRRVRVSSAAPVRAIARRSAGHVRPFVRT